MRVSIPVPVWAILCLLLTTSLAGCHGLDLTSPDNDTVDSTDGGDSGEDADDGVGAAQDTASDDEDDGTTQGDTDATPPPTNDDDTAGSDDPPAAPEFTFSITGAPGEVEVNETINLTVAVDGDSGTASTAELAYGSTSTASVADDELTADMFDNTTPGDPTSLEVPGSFAVNDWRLQDSGTVYFRAHIVVDDGHYWSNEFSLAVTEPPTVQVVTATPDHTIDMPEPLVPGQFAFDPADLTIAIGDKVQWTNSDSTPHTTTSSADPPLWDSGNMDNGDTSSVYQFNKAGTYEYKCSYHSSMTGTITVE